MASRARGLTSSRNTGAMRGARVVWAVRRRVEQTGRHKSSILLGDLCADVDRFPQSRTALGVDLGNL